MAGGGPTANHNLMARPAFCLRPGFAATRQVGCVKAFGHDAFEGELTRRPQDSIAPRFEVFDVADIRLGTLTRKDRLQTLLSFGEREGSDIAGDINQQIEGKEDKILGISLGQRGLERRKIRCAVCVEGDDLPIDDAVWKVRGRLGDRVKLRRPVQALARSQSGRPVLDPELNPVAVEFDLVNPILSARRTVNTFAELGRDELRQGLRMSDIRPRNSCLLARTAT